MEQNVAAPSPWWYGVAVLVVLVGTVGFVWQLVTGLSGMESGLQRVVVPGRAELTVESPGRYTIYYEYQSVVDGRVYQTGEELPPLVVRVSRADSGAAVPVEPSVISETYTMGSAAGRSLLSFAVEEPGRYLLEAEYEGARDGAAVVLAVGQGVAGRMLKAIGGAVALLFGGLLLGGGIGVVTFLRRRKANWQGSF